MNIVQTQPYYLYSLTLFLLCFVAGIFFFSKHSKPILLSGLLALPQSLLSPIVIPEYWDPEMIILIGAIGFEDMAFSFIIGGIAWMCVLPFFPDGRYSYKAGGVAVRRYILCSFLGVGGITVLYISGIRGLANPLIIMILWIFSFLVFKRKFLGLATVGAFTFLLVYTLLFKISIILWPEFINYWNEDNLSGYFPAGIPLEELAWAFLYGGAWSLSVAFILGFNKESGPGTREA